jgi:hypothetical protein
MSPHLPPELERAIFEQAPVQCMLSLMQVAFRVYTWCVFRYIPSLLFVTRTRVKPVYYKTVVIAYCAPIEGIPWCSTVGQVYSLLEHNLPAVAMIQNLLVDFPPNQSAIARLLPHCHALTNLALLYCIDGKLANNLGQIPNRHRITRLRTAPRADWNLFPATLPNLTHLHMYQSSMGTAESIQNAASCFTHLTHIALTGDDADSIEEALECNSTRRLQRVVLLTIDREVADERSVDTRFVRLYVPHREDCGQDWQIGVTQGVDVWYRAEHPDTENRINYEHATEYRFEHWHPIAGKHWTSWEWELDDREERERQYPQPYLVKTE